MIHLDRQLTLYASYPAVGGKICQGYVFSAATPRLNLVYLFILSLIFQYNIQNRKEVSFTELGNVFFLLILSARSKKRGGNEPRTFGKIVTMPLCEFIWPVHSVLSCALTADCKIKASDLNDNFSLD